MQVFQATSGSVFGATDGSWALQAHSCSVQDHEHCQHRRSNHSSLYLPAWRFHSPKRYLSLPSIFRLDVARCLLSFFSVLHLFVCKGIGWFQWKRKRWILGLAPTFAYVNLKAEDFSTKRGVQDEERQFQILVFHGNLTVETTKDL